MYHTLKKAMSLLVAVSLLFLWISALLLTQTPVQAVDSNFTTASQLKKVVDGLSAASPLADVQAVAAQMAKLSDSEKRRVSSATLRDLAQYYNTAAGISPSNGRDRISVDHGDETGSRRIDEDGSYACGVSAGWADGKGHRLQIEQEDSSSSVQLKMTFSGLRGPAYVNLDMEGSPFSSSRDYYLKWDGYKISASISSGSLRFVAPGNGVYRLYRDNDTGSHSDRYYGSSQNWYTYPDKPSTGSSNLDYFWRPVDASIKNAKSGDRVRVNLGAQTSVPFQILQSLYGRDVTLALYESDGNIISIYGKEMASPSSNLSVAALRRMYTITPGPSEAPGSSVPEQPEPPSSMSGSITPPNAGGAPVASGYTAPAASSPASQTPPPTTGGVEKDTSLPKTIPLEIEPVLNFDALEPEEPQEKAVVYQEPVKIPLPEKSNSRIQRIATRAGMGNILLFMGLAGLTAGLGGGLLTHWVVLRRSSRQEIPPRQSTNHTKNF